MKATTTFLLIFMLTFDVYTHVDQVEQSAAVSTLPSPPSQPSALAFSERGDSDSECARETQKIRPGDHVAKRTKVADICTPKSSATCGRQKTIKLPVICNVCQQMADKKESGQGRDRTGDTRIFSPLLYQLSYLTFPKTPVMYFRSHFLSIRGQCICHDEWDRII
jgi:hypothetical protein